MKRFSSSVGASWMIGSLNPASLKAHNKQWLQKWRFGIGSDRQKYNNRSCYRCRSRIDILLVSRVLLASRRCSGSLLCCSRHPPVPANTHHIIRPIVASLNRRVLRNVAVNDTRYQIAHIPLSLLHGAFTFSLQLLYHVTEIRGPVEVWTIVS